MDVAVGSRTTRVWDDRRRLVAWSAVLVVLVGAIALGWVWRHPTVLTPAGGGVSVSNDRWVVDRPLYVGVTHPSELPDGGITVRGAEPDIAVDTAAAETSFGVCTTTPTMPVIGSVTAPSVDEICSRWVPLEGESVFLDDGADERQQVLMLVVPRRPGVVEIAGVDLDYTHGWRTGSQHVGEHLLLEVR